MATDQLGNLTKSEIASQKEKDDLTAGRPLETCDTQGEHLVQRCVIIQRDEKGYGLTVSGDNPVFVQSVKEDGAAARAGVQQGDRIIKVNGTLVTQSNHQDVVKLIKSGSYVALTLLGKPPGHGARSSGTLQPLNLSGNTQSSSHISVSSKLSSPSERITGPQPVDPEKQQQLTNSRISTIRKMLEKELVYFENLQGEYSKSPSEKLRAEFHSAMKRVKTLEEQLHNLTSAHHDLSAPRSPRSPPANRYSHSEKENIRSTSTSLPGHLSSHQGRTLTHQMSAPTLPKSEKGFTHVVPIGTLSDSSSPSSTSPSQQKRSGKVEGQALQTQKQLSSSTSLENISTQLSPRTASTTWPQGTHSRQSSSPDALLHHVESLRHHRSDSQKLSPADSLSRSYSEAGHYSHGRKSSSSEVFSSEVEVVKRRRPTKSSSRGSSFGQYDSAAESPLGTSPGTPPLQDAEVEVTELGGNSEGDDVTKQEEYGTPPEGQVSPSGTLNAQSLASRLGQHSNIICMEDDEFSSDTEMTYVDDHGPFNGIWKLVRNPAHLSVFLYYLMSNSDPSSLFFYLIADMYEQGTGKEMKKWAYEIHSTFLFPKSPLKVHSVEETILHEIDEVLQHHLEREDILKTVFLKATKRAKEELNDLLADFRNKRTMGLGNIFGPPDYQLEEALHDKNKELKIIEQLLLPTLENFVEDLDNLKDRPLAMAFALATILKQFGIKSQQALNTLEKCPTFVAKEKTKLRILQRNKKVIFAQDHNFVPQHYYCVTYCNHCQLIIWGVGNQGYQCQNCEMNIHKLCVKSVEEPCIGVLRNKKDRRRDRMSEIMENIIGKSRKPSHPVPAAIERAKKLNEEWNSDSGISSLYTSNSEIQADCEKVGSTGRLDKMKDGVDGEEHPLPFSDVVQNDIEKPNLNKKGTSIGRSESFRQRRESRPSFRKRSDPNIPRSKSDVDVDDKSTSNLDNSGSSSNSSLSTRSLDSPSNSLEMVHRTPSGTPADSVPAGSTPAAGLQSTHVFSPSTVLQDNDSDLEAETDPPNWQENVEWEVVRLMKPKEKKRQDVINELFHTERTHVKNLKVLDRLFYRPLIHDQLLPPEFLQLLFPNLEEMLEIHGGFNEKMKTKRKEESIVGDVGEMMLQMFEGESGENLKRAAATFCRNQTVALENLKVRQRKDQKLAQFLADVEGHHLCRRLQLKDIIATGFQRLTKYPLLLENIAKYTAPSTDEYNNLLRAVECSKQILADANQAVKDAENHHHLAELQKKLDKSAFEKVEHPIAHNYKNLDLTKHKLLHDGPLTWRLNKQKTIEMHVVLLEDILVLLQKQDEKYILKFHNTNLMTGREDTKVTHSPILRVLNLFTRNVATDKRGFFLVSTSEQHAIYEFVAASPAERKIWLRHIAEATESCKSQRGVTMKHQEPSHLITDRTESTEENSEESESRHKEITQQDNLSEHHETAESSDTGEAADISLPTDKQVATSTPSATVSSGSESPITFPQKDEAPSPEPERKPQRKLQRVEILQIADGPQLIEPCEVVVSHGAVLQTAEPVLTPIEQLRRKDQQITSVLKEKEKLVADILQLQHEDFEHVAELAGEMEGEKDAQELVLASILQANQLTQLLNETLRVTEEDAVSASSVEVMPEEISENANLVTTSASATSVTTPSPPLPSPPAVTNSTMPSPKLARKLCKMPGASPQRLMVISTALNKCLTHLLSIITEHEEERKQLRKELHNSREQIHLLHEAHRHCTFRSHSPSNHSISHSRPSSFISIASSASEGVYEPVDHHFSPVSEERSKEVMSESEEIADADHSQDCDLMQCSEDYTVEDGVREMFVDAPSEESCKEHCQVTDLDSEIGITTDENEVREANFCVNNSSTNSSKDTQSVTEAVYKEDESLSSWHQSHNESEEKSVDPVYF